MRFNLDHEEFFYEPEPDSRRILGLLKQRAADEYDEHDEHDVGIATAVYEIGGGAKSQPEQQKEPAKEAEREPSPSPASPASPSSLPSTSPGSGPAAQVAQTAQAG